MTDITAGGWGFPTPQAEPAVDANSMGAAGMNSEELAQANQAAWPTAEEAVAYEPEAVVEESPEAFIRRRDDEIAVWLEAKTAKTTAEELEMANRTRLSMTLFPSPKKGTQHYLLNGGYKVTLVHGWNFKLGDKDKINDQGTKVTIAEQVLELESKIAAIGPEGELLVKRLIKWSPELAAAEYEKLAAADASPAEVQAKVLIDEILTVTPASPQLKWVEPKPAT